MSATATDPFSGIYWHQKWEVLPGLWTPGRNPVNEILDYAGVPHDLTGKTVLDIGAWNGCFSFECARRGAKSVLAYSLENPATEGFDRLASALNTPNVSYRRASVYDLSPETVGEFDVVLFFGVIYHLRYPLLALDKIRRVCREALYVESYVSDADFAAGAFRFDSSVPLWRFYPGAELSGDPSNWFGPNAAALSTAVETAGFGVTYCHAWADRAALAAIPVQGHGLATYEAMIERELHCPLPTV